MTRFLTIEEIDNILDFITPQSGIPYDSAMSIVNNMKERFKAQLITQQVYPEIIPILKEQIEKNYRQSLMQPGESVGIICAQSIGEKNTQLTLNSVDWKEKILYIKNTNSIIEPIGKFIDRVLEEFPENITFIETNRTQYLSLPDGYYIPSCNSNGMCNWYKIEAVTKHLPIEKLVKVTTQSGRNVIATQSKSFLVWNDEKFIHTLGSNINIGDVLPTTHTLLKPPNIEEYLKMESIFPKDKYVYTTELIKAQKFLFSGKIEWIKNNGKEFILPYKTLDICLNKTKKYFFSCKPNSIHILNNFLFSIPDKIHLDNDFGFFIGIYLSEGWITQTFINISNKNNLIINRVTDFCDKYKLTYHVYTNNSKNIYQRICNYVKIDSIFFVRMFKLICDTTSENKKVPSFVYNAPNDFIKGLINGYFSGNGKVNKIDGSISMSSLSKNLMTGMSFLLSYFGIFGILSKTQTLKSYNCKKNIKRKFTITINNEFSKVFAKEIYITETQKQEKLQKITLLKKYKYKYGVSQKNFPERNVYFDKIISIEYVNGSTNYVYDLTVAETRNFQLFNGLNCADTFHKAGQSEKAVTAGVPRFQELLNATKTPRNVSCKIYFKEGNDTIKNLRTTIGNSIVGLTIKDLSKSIKVVINKNPEPWYESFKILYNDKFLQYTNCISIKLKIEKMFEYKITAQQIVDVIEKEYDDISCVFSPCSKAQLDIFIATNNIELPEERLIFIDSSNSAEIYLEECVQPIIENILICGIKGITDIYYMQKDNEWMIETDGTNFKKLLSHPLVDMTRVISNNVWEIYETLGIEAAREFLIEEYMNIMDGINICHTKLLVERMTHSGTIASISRYTMRKEEAGPLGKASFEETLDNFLKAAANGDIEPTNGVSASIICGKRANIGTGMMDIKIDINQLPFINSVEDSQENIEEDNDFSDF